VRWHRVHVAGVAMTFHEGIMAQRDRIASSGASPRAIERMDGIIAEYATAQAAIATLEARVDAQTAALTVMHDDILELMDAVKRLCDPGWDVVDCTNGLDVLMMLGDKYKG
jgi:hypothetical protein